MFHRYKQTIMDLKLFAFLLLVPVISASIEVQVNAADNLADSAVRLGGNIVNIISDTERNTFKLSDNLLKNAVESYFGKRPDDAYLRSPTPWGDLYNTYGWQQVTRTLSPQRSTILSLESQPTIVMTQYFENNSSNPASFTAAIKQSVANTVTTTWENSQEFSIGETIKYAMNIEVFSVGGSTSFSFTGRYGESNSKSETVTVGSESGVKIELEPNQNVIAELYATRGTMKIQVEYEASLSGVAAVNYKKIYQGHHFWALPINEVMRAGGMTRTFKSTEIINMGYYTDSKVVIRDSNSRKALYSLPLKIFK
jgi:hypothetical protein